MPKQGTVPTAMTDGQRWLIFGTVLVLGALTAIGALLLWPVARPPSAHLAAYERLWSAMERGVEGVATLDSLLGGQDGVAWHASMAAGRTLMQSGAPEEAVPRFRRAVELWPTADTHSELARALEAAGEREKALAQWEMLLPAAEAAQSFRRLEIDPLQAAKVLNRSGAHRHALEALAGLPGREAILEKARALSGLGDHSQAAASYRTYLTAVPGDSQAQLEYGQLLERSGQTAQALAAYRAAGPPGGLCAGILLEQAGRVEEALTAYSSSTDPEAAWRRALLLEDLSREGEALPLYKELADGTHRVWDDAALRAYVLLAHTGDQTEAEGLLGRLPPAALSLLSHYNDPPVTDLQPDPHPVEVQAIQRAEALFQHFPEEAWDWARAELEVALRRGTVAERLAIGEWYLSRGDYAAACRVGMEVLSASRSQRAYRLAYPLAYWNTVQERADQYRVDPYLVLSVMREESHFRLRAVSPSGAHGLMQLLPSTARWIAEDRLGAAYEVEILFEADTNIRLGAWYLGYLVELFPQGEAWAVAAYNAGQGNIRRWTGGEVALHDLPAALRLVETREYLSKVLNSWLVYRWLYGS